MRQFIIVVLVLIVSFSLISAQSAAQSQIQPGYDSFKIIEKVYLHTDRDIYNPGDDIWFSAYLIDASEQLLTDHSNNLHVELISPSLEIMSNRVVKLTGGLGYGDFHLDDKLKSGRYRIRAYTNFMRNYGDQLFFNREITIINTSDVKNTSNDSNTSNTSKPDLQFFPESGSMMDNVLSVVAFKATGTDGYSIDVEGEIYSSDNEKVADFKSIHNGMGSFSLKPLPDKNYYARLKTQNGEIVKYDLPGSFFTGIVMSLSKNLKDELTLTFNTSPEALPLYLNKDFYLTVSARKIPLETYSFRIRTLKNYLNLPTVNLPEGILMLTLSGVVNLPLCERLVYIEKSSSNGGIDITTSKKVFKQRDSVCVKLSSMGNPEMQGKLFLSLSAANELFIDDPASFSSTISSWFLLESDVRGPVEEPSIYFDNSNPDRLKDIELLLLTQGWRDFKWKYDQIKYPSEYGFTISGKARKLLTDVPLRNSDVTIVLFDSLKPVISTIRVDSSGRFSLEDIYLMGHTKLIASISDDKDKLKGWIVLDSTRYDPAPVNKTVYQEKKREGENRFITQEGNLIGNISARKKIESFKQYSDYRQSLQKKYKLSDTINPGEVTITAWKQDAPDSPRARSLRYLRTGMPDKEILITPFIKAYGTMRNYLDNVLLNPVTGMKNPVYLIDGVAMSKTEAATLPFALIERIDVLDKHNFAGYSTFLHTGVGTPDDSSTYGGIDGVVSIILTEPSQWESLPVYHSVNKEISGYDEPRIFYSPRHKTTLEKDYKPDLRSTLYWNPDIILEDGKDLTLDYYNSDNSGTFRITVEGITDTGIPVSKTINYSVE